MNKYKYGHDREAIDYADNYTDVIVEMENGAVYVASFFTYQSISSLIDKHRMNGEYLGGKYYWAEDMVLIDKCGMEDVKKVIQHLIEEGDFLEVFRKL
ncbi:MAG: hypothetical protein R2824_18785 [Saprospiraceae bacterium]|nr:hypothetical protein [Lewinella sp.]